MSRGLGKVERAVLAALPDDGSMKSVYQLAIDVFGPWHLDKHIFNVGASKDVKLADPNDKISVRRAVVRLKRAGLVETLPCTVTVPKVGYWDGFSFEPGIHREAIVNMTRTRGNGVRRVRKETE